VNGAMNMSQRLAKFKQEVREGTLHFSSTFHYNGISIGEEIKNLGIEEKLEAFYFVFQTQIDEYDEDIKYQEEEYIQDDTMSLSSKEKAKRRIASYEEKKKEIQNRQDIIRSLQEKLKEDAHYDFDLEKVYEMKNWDFSHYADSGTRADGDIECYTVKVVTNSVFENAYQEFFLGIKDGFLTNGYSDKPYICVEPTEGKYKDFGFYVPIDHIIK